MLSEKDWLQDYRNLFIVIVYLTRTRFIFRFQACGRLSWKLRDRNCNGKEEVDIIHNYRVGVAECAVIPFSVSGSTSPAAVELVLGSEDGLEATTIISRGVDMMVQIIIKVCSYRIPFGVSGGTSRVAVGLGK